MKEETKAKARKYDNIRNRQRESQRAYNASLRARGLRQVGLWLSEDQIPLIRAAKELPPELLRRAIIAVSRASEGAN